MTAKERMLEAIEEAVAHAQALGAAVQKFDGAHREAARAAFRGGEYQNVVAEQLAPARLLTHLAMLLRDVGCPVDAEAARAAMSPHRSVVTPEGFVSEWRTRITAVVKDQAGTGTEAA